MTAETVLVCVTGQRMCERLIQRGAEVAQEHQLPLLVLSVVGNGQNSLGDPAVADALDYLLNGNYDGAILDIMMPKMDGITVLKAMTRK